MRDFPRDEMPLGEKAQGEDLKGMEEGGNLPSSRNWSFSPSFVFM